MRGWEDYKVGFGDFDREFWLGNILIWALTNVDNSTFYELALDMEDWSGNRRFARYRSFRMGSERDAFRLYHQNLYYGNAGDSMYSHNGLPFSTFDVDNDNRDGEFAERSCARLYKVKLNFLWALKLIKLKLEFISNTLVRFSKTVRHFFFIVYLKMIF